MSKRKPDPQRPWREFLLGWSALLIPLAGIAWWIIVTQTTPGEHADMVARFRAPFPDFMHVRGFITWIQIAFAGLAAILFFRGMDHRGVAMWANLAMLCFSGLIGFWLLFSLM